METQLVRKPTTVEQNSALLNDVAAGDRHAFVVLYQQFSGGAYRIVQSVIRDSAQAEEVTQEVFLSVWRRAKQYDASRGSVGTYINMLAHSKAVERVRSSQAARNRDDKYGANNIERNELHDPVSERALLREEHMQVRQALTGLTKFQQEAIKLHYFDRRSYVEAGQLLGVSVTAVKARVRSGVVQLRCILAAAP
jgi:RNA polymerase sigma-70 factor (ECF subfamily)